MDKKVILIVILATIVILVGGIFFLGSKDTPEINASENAKALVFAPVTYDLGDIPINGGEIAKDFSIKNAGTETLKLYNIMTSCHCTRARVAIEEAVSPDFGMDSYSSWVGEVSPGKEAKLTVLFDPAYHGPSGTGPFNRFVSVVTNDKSNSKLTFTLTGTVIKGK